MVSKKSQITLFIILGIVLLFSFTLLYYASSLSTENQTDTNNVQSLVKSSLLNSYITKCLQRVAVDGMLTLGNRGSKIYLASSDKKLDHNGKPVLYGITKSELPSWKRFPFPFQQTVIPFPYFGKDNMPALCDTNGPNLARLNYQPCISYSTQDSIQTQLKTYVELNLDRCTNLDALFTGIEHGKPSVEVIIGEEDIKFKLDYSVNYSTDRQRFQLRDFNYGISVRIKKFHEFVKAVIKSDTTDTDFDIIEDYKELPEYEDGFSIRKAPVAGSFADLIMIDDFSSIIDGHAYSLRFARENRAPVIKDIEIKPRQAIVSLPNEAIRLRSPSSVMLVPEVADPDEDAEILLSTNDPDSFVFMDDDTFVWQSPYVGVYDITITADDRKFQDKKTVEFSVIN